MFFSADGAAMVEAAVDRLIPADNRGPGGKDAGCAVFIDRQTARATFRTNTVPGRGASITNSKASFFLRRRSTRFPRKCEIMLLICSIASRPVYNASRFFGTSERGSKATAWALGDKGLHCRAEDQSPGQALFRSS